MNDEPVRFSAFLERALYDPDLGFYETGGRAGRRGDFVTSPEVGPLFGACLARSLDRWWQDLGRPDPFLVDEHGAGPATLARTVVVAAPACGSAVRWTLVERSSSQRLLHPPHLPHVGDLAADGSCADARWARSGEGPLVASAADRPGRPAHVIVANELLDDLPFDLLERAADGWQEVGVVPTPGDAVTGGGGATERARSSEHPVGPGSEVGARSGRRGPQVAPLPAAAEVRMAATPADAALATALVPGARTGARIPRQRLAGEWLVASLAQLAPGGRVVVCDYATTTADLAARPPEEWIRTYAGQARGVAPLGAPGGQDVTVEVCVDQLAAAGRPPDLDRDQASALRAWGLDDLVEEGRRLWGATAPAPDLAALRARSRVAEAAVLTDPSGLGAFRVLEWDG